MERKDFNDVKNTLKSLLAKERRVLFCYMFGSVVRGDAIETSDVDIAIYFLPDSRPDFFDMRLALMEKCVRVLGREVDVIVLNNASPFLRYGIVKEGVLVYERDENARIDFELRAMNEYFDYRPVLNLYRERLANAA